MYHVCTHVSHTESFIGDLLKLFIDPSLARRISLTTKPASSTGIAAPSSRPLNTNP